MGRVGAGGFGRRLVEPEEDAPRRAVLDHDREHGQILLDVDRHPFGIETVQHRPTERRLSAPEHPTQMSRLLTWGVRELPEQRVDVIDRVTTRLGCECRDALRVGRGGLAPHVRLDQFEREFPGVLDAVSLRPENRCAVRTPRLPPGR